MTDHSIEREEQSQEIQVPIRTIPLEPEFFFFPDGWQAYPLCEWKTRIEPGFHWPAVQKKKTRIESAIFWVEFIPHPFYLVWDGFTPELPQQIDDDSVIEFRLNGILLEPANNSEIFTGRQLAFPIQENCWLGRNELIIKSTASLQNPVSILGNISIAGNYTIRDLDDMDVISEPPSTLKTGSWTEQGFPYFAGAGVYRQKIIIQDSLLNRTTTLRFENICDQVEISINGREAGTLLEAPWKIDLTEFIISGENLVEFRIDNRIHTDIPLPQKPSGLLGPVYVEVY